MTGRRLSAKGLKIRKLNITFYIFRGKVQMMLFTGGFLQFSQIKYSSKGTGEREQPRGNQDCRENSGYKR